MKSVRAIASPNIALIKYWGKRDEEKVLPLNSSLSITLSSNDLYTETIIKEIDGDSDILVFNGLKTEFSNRMKNIIKIVRNLAKERFPSKNINSLKIETKNSFPTAAGLASSASGMACLVVALTNYYGLKEAYKGEFSGIARIGSGSASRSLYGGFVIWDDGVDNNDISIASPLSNKWDSLRVLILVTNSKQKAIGSTVGMNQSVKTSNKLKKRTRSLVNKRIELMKEAIEKHDFTTVASLTMSDSNDMHAICRDTSPSIVYLNETSNKIIDTVHKINKNDNNLIVGYTFDAGPNGVLIFELENIMIILNNLVKAFGYSCFENTIPLIEDDCNCKFDLENDKGMIIDGNEIERVIYSRIGDGPKCFLEEN